jgi:hypothetical protein
MLPQIPAVFILGLLKGGFGALGLLMVPIMALAVSPIRTAGITLPILVLSDIVDGPRVKSRRRVP